jgi:hypothetical protein
VPRKATAPVRIHLISVCNDPKANGLMQVNRRLSIKYFVWVVVRIAGTGVIDSLVFGAIPLTVNV